MKELKRILLFPLELFIAIFMFFVAIVHLIAKMFETISCFLMKFHMNLLGLDTKLESIDDKQVND